MHFVSQYEMRQLKNIRVLALDQSLSLQKIIANHDLSKLHKIFYDVHYEA
jgi:tRNA G46 methylase TrmB